MAEDTTTAVSRRRLVNGLRPHATLDQVVIGLLFAVLGFGLVLQVRTTAATDGLATARQSDLVRILDDLSARNSRLEAERQALQSTRDDLVSGGDRTETALREARARTTTLGILAGTVAATGPGIELTVLDPRAQVDAAAVLDSVQELRDAGAEAIQVGAVRVVAQTSFVDGPQGELLVDGIPVARPYQTIAIGDPATLGAALRIPGGVLDSLARVGAEGRVSEQQQVTVDALRPLTTPQYARPSPGAS